MGSVKNVLLQGLYNDFLSVKHIPFQRWTFERLGDESRNRKKRPWRGSGHGGFRATKYWKGSGGSRWCAGSGGGGVPDRSNDDTESEDESTDTQVIKVSAAYRRTRVSMAKWRGCADAKLVVIKDCVNDADMSAGIAFSGEEGDAVLRVAEEAGYGSSVLMLALVGYPLPRDAPLRVEALRKHVCYIKTILRVVRPEVVVCTDSICAALLAVGFSLARACHVHKSMLQATTPLPKFPYVEKISCFTEYLHSVKHAFHGALTPTLTSFKGGNATQEWAAELKQCLMSLNKTPDPLPSSLVYDVQAMADRTEAHMVSKGCSEEEVQAMYDAAERTGFDTPANRLFYVPPESAKVRKMDTLPRDVLVFCMTNVHYDGEKNVFHAFGAMEGSPEGLSVHVEIHGASFTFWSTVPSEWNLDGGANFNEARMDALLKDVENALRRKLYGVKGAARKEIPEWIAEPPDPSVSVKVIDGKKDNSKVYLPTMPCDKFLQFTVGSHVLVRLVVDHLRSAFGADRDFKIFHGNHTAIQYLAFFGHVWCGCWTEVKLDGGARVLAAAAGGKEAASMVSTCDLEVSVHVSKVRSHSHFDDSAKYSDEDKKRWSKRYSRRVLVVDMEMKGVDNAFPRPTSSPIISICCEIHHYGDSTAFNSEGFSNAYDVYCFALGMTLTPPWSAGGNRVKKKWAREFDYHFETELEMIAAWAKFVREADPDEIVGHNHKSFDLWYVTERYRHLACALSKQTRACTLPAWGLGKELCLGRLKNVYTHVTKRRFFSKASGERMIYTVHCMGRNVVDTLDLFMKLKERKYTLNYLAGVYLKAMKNDVDYTSIPVLYDGGFYTLYELNEYCKQDVSLTARLYNIRKCSIGLAETCRILRCMSMEHLAVSGQQEKVFGAVMAVNVDMGQPLLIESKPFQRDAEEDVIEDEDVVCEDAGAHEEGENPGGVQTTINEEEESRADDPDGGSTRNGKKHERRSEGTADACAQKKKRTKQLSLFAFVEDENGVAETDLGDKPKFVNESKRGRKKAAEKKKPRYKGGFVRGLKPGLTDKDTYLISLDFNSMYPNNHRTFNIDHGRLMYDSDFDLPRYKGLIRRDQCYLIEGDKNDEEDKVTGINPATGKEESIYFVPANFAIGGQTIGLGFIPLTVEMLLRLRKFCRDQQKLHPPGSMAWSVLEEQQLAFKLIANSVYGASGAKTGTLAKMEIAMSITAEGRKHINIAEEVLRKHVEAVYAGYPVGTELPWPENVHERVCREMRTVGGDTDSVFPAFPFVASFEEAVEFGVIAEYLVNKVLPRPMAVEFEKVIHRFFSVATKRYAGFFVIDGSLDSFYAKKRWIELNEPKESWPDLFARHRWALTTKTPDDSFEGIQVKTERFASDEELAARIGAEKATEIFRARGTPAFSKACALSKFETVALEDWFAADVIASKKTWFERLDAQKKKALALVDSQGLREWVRVMLKAPRYEIPGDNPKKRGKTAYRGIETVRRDACLYTKDIMEKFLETVIVEDRVEEAVNHYKQYAIKLLSGGVDPSMLLCANQYSKPYRAYKNPNLPHLGVVKRLIDAGEEPSLGTRVQYLVHEADPHGKRLKDVKLYEHCCSPDEFITKRLRIDYKHYFNRFLAGPFKPLLTVVGADVELLTNADKLLASSKKRKFELANRTLMSTCVSCKRSFVKARASDMVCMSCTVSITSTGGKCAEMENAMNHVMTDIEDIGKEMRSRLDECERCTNKKYAHPDQVICKTYECKNYFGMRTVKHRLEAAHVVRNDVKRMCVRT